MNLLEFKNPKASLARKTVARRFIGGLKRLDLTLALTPALSPRREFSEPKFRALNP